MSFSKRLFEPQIIYCDFYFIFAEHIKDNIHEQGK